MKTLHHRSTLILGCLSAVVSLAAAPMALHAQQRYIWTGGTGSWGDGLKWSKPDGTYPYPYPVVLSGTSVLIDGGKTGTKSVVTLDNSDAPTHYGASSVTIDAGDTLQLQGYANFSTITNNGAINFSAISGGGYELQFSLGGGTINGSGAITMTEDDQYIHTPNNPDRITIGSGQTIQGRGNLGDGNTNFTNHGVVDANVSGQTLRLYPGYNTVDFTNSTTGVAEATNGGILLLDNSYGKAVFKGGTFIADDGSKITTKASPTLSNITLMTAGTGVLSIADGTVMTGLTVAGHLDVTGTASFDGVITSTGVITDNGGLTFPNGLDNEGGTLIIGDDDDFRVYGDLANDGTIELGTSVGAGMLYTVPITLSGTGTLDLNGPSALVQGPNKAGAERLTIDAGVTVEGQGDFLGNDGTCTNEGLVTANVSGGTLTISPNDGDGGDFTNSGNGYAEAASGGTLNLIGGLFKGNSFRALAGSKITLNGYPTLQATTLSTTGTGEVDVLSTATFTNVTLNGTLNSEGATCMLVGKLTNNGTINLDNGGAIQLNDAVTFAGTGTINFNYANDTLTANVNETQAQERLTISAGLTIQGQGNFGADRTVFTNKGVVLANISGTTLNIAPDSSPGGDFTNSGSGYAEATNGATLQLSGGIFAGGHFEALAGSTLSLASGTFTNTTLSSTGTGDVVVGSFITVNDVILSGTINNPDGQLHLSGPLTNNGTISLGTPSSTAEINFEGAGALTNATGHRIGGLGIIRSPVINNGTIATAFGGGGALTFTSSAVTNNGTLLVADDTTLSQDTSSTLTNYGASTQTLTGGTYRVNAGGHATTLSLNIGTVAVNNATVILSGANSVFTPISGLIDNEGTFSLLALRQFTTIGALSNAGEIDLDAGCTLHVAGKFTASSDSTLSFVIGGTSNSGVKSPGVLESTGAGKLAGELSLTFAAGATLPASSATLTILSAGATLTGSFANVVSGTRLDTADGKGSFVVNYGASSKFTPSRVVLSNFSTKLASVITSPRTATATEGKAFSYQIKATESPTSFGAAGLPAGLAINVQTGLISGTPSAAGSYSVTLKAVNNAGTASEILTLTVDPSSAPVITSAKAAAATVGKTFSYAIKATNTPTAYGATGLPSGLSIDAKTGNISGTPASTAAGTKTINLKAANAIGTGTETLTVTISKS